MLVNKKIAITIILVTKYLLGWINFLMGSLMVLFKFSFIVFVFVNFVVFYPGFLDFSKAVPIQDGHISLPCVDREGNIP